MCSSQKVSDRVFFRNWFDNPLLAQRVFFLKKLILFTLVPKEQIEVGFVFSSLPNALDFVGFCISLGLSYRRYKAETALHQTKTKGISKVKRFGKSWLIAALFPVATSASATVCLDPPNIDGTPSVGAAPTGWSVNNQTPDIISGNGPWPGGGGYVISDISGASTSGGQMGVFLKESTNGFEESWKTNLTGLTVGQTYTVAVEWQQATFANNQFSYDGGELILGIQGGVSQTFASTGTIAADSWQTATLTFTATQATEVFTAGIAPSAVRGAIVIDSGAACSNVNPGNATNNPAQKPDVVGIVEATKYMGLRYVDTNIKAITTRLEWLRNHPEASGRSHQGIKITFANPLEGSSQAFKDHAGINPSAWVSDTVNAMANELIAEALTGGNTLNSTGGPLVGDWSAWTEGQIVVGKRKAKGGAPQLDADLYGITLGLDRPRDHRVEGFAITLGKGGVDVGSLGSKVDSEFLSISAYTAFEPKNMPLMEATLGVGTMRAKSTRVDDVQTLKGTRNNTAFFGSYKFHGKEYKQENFVIKPYGAFEATYLALHGYEETGGSSALNFGKQNVRQATLMVGVDLNHEYSLGQAKLKPFSKFELGYDKRKTSVANLNYVGDLTQYRLDLGQDSDLYLLVRVGADYDIKDDVSVTVSFEHTQTRKSGYSNAIRGKLNWKF